MKQLFLIGFGVFFISNAVSGTWVFTQVDSSLKERHFHVHTDTEGKKIPITVSGYQFCEAFALPGSENTVSIYCFVSDPQPSREQISSGNKTAKLPKIALSFQVFAKAKDKGTIATIGLQEWNLHVAHQP